LPDIAAARAILCLYLGDTDTAVQLVQNEDRLLVRAEVLIAQRDPSAALAILVSHRQEMEELKLEDRLVVTMMLQALALHEEGEIESSLQVLKETLIKAKTAGFIRLFVDLGEPMRSLFIALRASFTAFPGNQDPSLSDYVDKILEAFSAPVNKSSAVISETKSDLIEALSARELEVLQLISQGLSNQEIGKRLYLALDTVKGHNRRIFEKLQVQRRTEAIARARELGLI
jgi:LuxR family maltose regulon positive regulatory protein